MKHGLSALDDLLSFGSRPFRRAQSEISTTYGDLQSLIKEPYVTVGGTALALLGFPRGTQDIDILVASESSMSRLNQQLSDKFRKHRAHAFEHKSTGVEVEVLTPEFVGIDSQLASEAISTAQNNVVLPQYFVALKFGRFSLQDMADISRILKARPEIVEEARRLITRFYPEKQNMFPALLRDASTIDLFKNEPPL
jgi:hypothetical protein